MLSRQVTLFREVQSFRLLALATVGSAFGTWLAFVALTIDVYDRTGSAVWVSALLIADFLPAIVIGIAASSLVDRLPRRRLMIASDLARRDLRRAAVRKRPRTIVALAAPPASQRGSSARRSTRASRTCSPTRIFRTGTHCSRRSRTSPGPRPRPGRRARRRAGPDAAYWINAVTFLVSAALLAGIPTGCCSRRRRSGAATGAT